MTEHVDNFQSIGMIVARNWILCYTECGIDIGIPFLSAEREGQMGKTFDEWFEKWLDTCQ